MKKKKTLIICMLLGIMLLTSCGKTDHQDQASVATEQTFEDSRQTTEEPAEIVGGSEESTEAAVTAQAAVEAQNLLNMQNVKASSSQPQTSAALTLGCFL